MDNTQDSQETSPLDPTAGMVPMGQGDTTQEQVPDTTQEETPQTADVEAEQSEAPEEDKAKDAERNLILGKFKSQEDLEKAYKELESKNTKVEMEKAEMDKFIQEAYQSNSEEKPTPTSQQEKTEEAPTTQEEALRQVADKLAPMIREQVVNPILNPAVARMEIREALDKYGENFKANAGKIQAIKKERPSLTLEECYKLATFDQVATNSKIEGVKQAARTAEEKVKAQVENSQPSGIRNSTIEDAIRDPKVSVAEIADAVPELEPFARISRERAKM